MGARYRGVWPASASSIGVRFRDDRGSWVREFVPIPPTAKNLRVWATRREVIRQEVAEGRFDYARWFPWSKRVWRGLRARDTVEDLLNAWLKRQEKVLEETSLRKCRQVVDNVLMPAFGSIAANQVQARTCSGLDRRPRAHPQDHLQLTLAAAASLCSGRAHRPGARPGSAGELQGSATPARPTAHRAGCRSFFADELAAAVANAQADLQPFVRFNVWTGLRLEEMLELHWPDVDIAGKRIWVHRARVGNIQKGPKTAASERYVSLLPEAIRALKEAQALSNDCTGHVFICLRTGQPWSGDAVRDAWRRACQRAGIRYRAPKQFRHTYAHRMLTAGENLAAISAELGHKDVAVTARVYAGFLAELESRKFGALAAARYNG